MAGGQDRQLLPDPMVHRDYYLTTLIFAYWQSEQPPDWPIQRVQFPLKITVVEYYFPPQMRAQLGLETTRGWSRQTVLRTAPCLLGLFTLVCLIYQEYLEPPEEQTTGIDAIRLLCLIYQEYLERHPLCLSPRPGYHKQTPSFSDALATVRKLFWEQTIFQHPCWQMLAEKIPPKHRSLLLDQLCFTP